MTSRPVILASAALFLGAGRADAQREHPITEVIRAPAAGIVARPGAKFERVARREHPGRRTRSGTSTASRRGRAARSRTKIGVEPKAVFRVGGTIRGTEPYVANDPELRDHDRDVHGLGRLRDPGRELAFRRRARRRLIVRMYYQTCNEQVLPPAGGGYDRRRRPLRRRSGRDGRGERGGHRRFFDRGGRRAPRVARDSRRRRRSPATARSRSSSGLPRRWARCRCSRRASSR